VAKSKTVYTCQQCGAQFPKWSGQCLRCQAWNTLVEEVVREQKKGRAGKSVPPAQPKRLDEIKLAAKTRVSTGSAEFDRALGGGVVPGSVVLVAGEPGIGKSTLLLQLAGQLDKEIAVIYASGEESEEQLKLRAERLGVGKQNLYLLAETDVDALIGAAAAFRKPDGKERGPAPLIVIADSIQAMETADLSGTPGSVGQVRECASRLQRLAKRFHLPLFIVGQVTKEGSVAGPKVLEHLVDAVVYLEGERFQQVRLLRAMKNRFGSTDEVGVFRMTDKGLADVANPSEMFLAEAGQETPGSVIVPTVEGTRPILVEIQALAVPSKFAAPRRVATGVSYQRLQFLAAVLQKRLGLPLDHQDVYVNVAGGLRVEEPAADLGICLALYSSLKNQPLPRRTAVVGEVGLLGEIRRVSQAGKRRREAEKLGYRRLLSPGDVKTLDEAVTKLFETRRR
jgi:DNA repair protein RadA/Sms